MLSECRNGALILGFLLLFQGLFPGTAAAAGAERVPWSFKDHPHPTYTNLTRAEWRRIESVDYECEPAIEASYAIYQRRYPSYIRVADTQTRLRNWKAHVLTLDDSYTSTCLMIEISLAWRDFLDSFETDPGFHYCGRLSRPPQTSQERAFAERIEDFVFFANTGNTELVATFILSYIQTIHFRLNDDVHYYWLNVPAPTGWPARNMRDRIYTPPERLRSLSAGYRTFIEEAAVRRDYEQIIRTTKPCAKR